MTWTKSVTLYCDCDGCPLCHDDTGCIKVVQPGVPTVKEARREAEYWSYKRGDDYCPGCSAYN